MNFTQLNDVDFLQQLANNQPELAQYIKDTEGYVLYMMERNDIKPDLSYLFTDLSPYSLNFIVKNYELTNEQIKIIKPYFESNSETITKKLKLSQEEIIEYLENNTLLPNTVVLNLDVLKKYAKEIIKMTEQDEYVMEKILNNSIDNLTVQEFLSLDRDFLRENVDMFNHARHWFKHEEFKQMYKELILETNAKSGHKPVLNHFMNYPFKEEDKDFFYSLLKENRYSFETYDKLAPIPGAQQLISKVDFFSQFKRSNIEYFSIEETEQYKETIQNVFLERFKKEKYNRFEKLIQRSSYSAEQMYIWLDKDFFAKLVDNADYMDNPQIESDKTQALEKNLYFKKMSLDYAIDNVNHPEKLDKIPYKYVMENLEYIRDKMYSIRVEERHIPGQLYKDIFEKVMPHHLKTENVSAIVGRHTSKMMNNDSVKHIATLCETHPTGNLLYAILHTCKEFNSGTMSYYLAKQIQEPLHALMSKLDKNTVETLANYFNYPIPEGMIYESAQPQKFEDNFLNYHGKEFTENEFDIFQELLKIKPEFGQYALDTQEEMPLKWLTSLMWRNAEGNVKDFCVSYIQSHQEQILADSDVTKNILQSETYNSYLKVDNSALMEKEYANFMVALDALKVLDTNPEVKDDDERLDSATNACKAFKEKFTFEFVQNKVIEALNNKDFYQVNAIYDFIATHSNHELFIDYVNKSDFNSLLKDIEKPAFFELLQDNIDYNGKTSIKFSIFNDRENKILAELLLPVFEEKKKHHVFSFFPKESYGFIKEFAIKHMPLEVLHASSLEYRKRTCESGFITNPYTPNQIIKLLKNAEKHGGMFNEKDTNARIADFFNSNFAEDKSNFLATLEKAKQYPKLYTVLGGYHVLTSQVKHKDETPQDEQRANFFIKHFDVDIVVEGMKQIAQEAYQHKDGATAPFSHKMAMSVINGILSTTSYEVRDTSHKDEYRTCLNDQQTDKIIKVLLNEVPYFLMGVHSLGVHENVSEHIRDNFHKYIEGDVHTAINKIMYPHPYMQMEHFSISGRYAKYTNEILDGMVNYLLNSHDEDGVRHLSYTLQQHTFFEKNLCYSTANKAQKRYSDIVAHAAKLPDIQKKLEIGEEKIFLEKFLPKQVAPVARRSNKI